MTDVFISYKREEREQARRIAHALGAQGISVWWDADILPGEQYRAVTLEILQSCRAAIVIWSPRSITSNWVLDEAQRALKRGVLIPVVIERIGEYPLGFGQVHAHDLIGWDGDPLHASFQPVLSAVGRLTRGGGTASASTPSSAAELETEIAFWRGVQDSRDAADFEAYLVRYREGLFANLAHRRIEALALAPKARGRVRKRAQTPQKSSGSAEVRRTTTAPQVAAASIFPAALGALRPPFDRWELGFVAIVALLIPFPLWPIVNTALGYEDVFYLWDMSELFRLDHFRNIFVIAPVLTGLVWLYDRGAAWWTVHQNANLRSGPFIAVVILLALCLLVSLGIRTNDGMETHAMLWIATVWTAGLFARAATPWARSRVSILRRLVSKLPRRN